MQIEPLKRDDIPSIGKLLRLTHPGYALPDFLVMDKIFGDSDFKPESTFLLRSGDEIIGFAASVVRNRTTETTGYIKFFAVHPEFQRKGIGSRLLSETEQILWRQGAERIRLFESYPNYYMPGVDKNYIQAIAFFESRGYKKFNETANMRVHLLETPFETQQELEILRTKGVVVKRAEIADKANLLNWITINFTEWKYEIEESYKNNPVTTFIAQSGESIAGFASYDTNNRGIGWFGPMGTDKQFRGLSIGRVLLKLCLIELRDIGYTSAIIPWVGPIPFYSQAVNAKVEKNFLRYEKNRNN